MPKRLDQLRRHGHHVRLRYWRVEYVVEDVRLVLGRERRAGQQRHLRLRRRLWHLLGDWRSGLMHAVRHRQVLGGRHAKRVRFLHAWL